MNWSKFYYDFAAAYGTCWLILLALALVTQSHIETGLFGLIGFPIVGAVYASMRRDFEHPAENEVRDLNERIARLERGERERDL